jgi:hypothetical protein
MAQYIGDIAAPKPPYYHLLGAATALTVEMQNESGARLRKLDIARRHALAGARLLAPDNDAYEQITAMLELPVV